MKKLFLLLIAIGITLGLHANDKRVEFKFGEITSIDVFYIYDIEVTYGKSNIVTIIYPDNIEKKAEIDVQYINGKLILSLQAKWGRSLDLDGSLRIVAKLQMRNINSLSLSGSCNFTAIGDFKSSHTFNLHTSGASRISNLSISSKSLDYICRELQKQRWIYLVRRPLYIIIYPEPQTSSICQMVLERLILSRLEYLGQL